MEFVPKIIMNEIKKHKFKWGSTILYEGANDTPYANVTSLSDKFKNIKFCEKCFIDIRSCWSGAIVGLAERVRNNSRILNDNVRSGFDGCTVRVYDESTDVFGLTGKPRDIGK